MYAQIISLTFIQGIGLLVSVGFLILIGLIVPQSEIGVYASLLAWLNICVALSGMGYEKLLIRDFKKNQDYDYPLFLSAISAQTMAAFTVGLLIVLFLPTLQGYLIPVFIFALLMTTVNRSFQRAIRLYGWPKIALTVEIVSIRFGLVFLGGYIWLSGNGMSGTAIFTVFAGLSGLAWLIYFSVFRITKDIKTRAGVESYKRKLCASLGAAKMFYLNNVVSVAAKEVDTVVAFHLLGAAEAASLFFARRAYNILSIINEGAAFGFEQDFSFNARQGNLKQLYSALRIKIVLLSCGLAVVLGIVLYLVEFQLLLLENIFYTSLIFMFVRIVENGIGPVFLVLNMRGKEAFVTVMVAVFFGLKIILFFTIPDISVTEIALVSGLTILAAPLFSLQRIRQI